MRIVADRDLWAGVMFVAFGALFAVVARNYPIGTPARMGSGFFPLLVGLFIAALGIVTILRALLHRARERVDLHPGPLLILVAGLCAFALLVTDGGIALAIAVLVVICARAGAEFRWGEAIATAVVLAAICIGAFVSVLGLPLAVWPAL